MANAVLTYTGNVCSTPMVSYASLTGDVFVPVMEQFDAYRWKRIVPEPERQAASLATALSALFAREPCELFERPNFRRFGAWSAVPTAAEKPHVLFKWRCFAPDAPNSDDLARVFEAHDVAPAMMFRRSIVEQAIKIWLSEKVYGGRHQQRQAARMTSAEYQRYRADQASMRVHVDDDGRAEIWRICSGFWIRTKAVVERTTRFFPHVASPPVILAEAVFRPLVDPGRFDAVLETLLGKVRPLNPSAEPAVRKAGLDLSHCANVEDVTADKRLNQIEEQYQELLSGLKLLVKAVPAS